MLGLGSSMVAQGFVEGALAPLLLDTYAGAAAAYSLRLLDSTYTGSAIRVRRASDDAEQDIGFDNNELDTSALAAFCAGTNGFVTTWYSQTGSNDATQTTTGSQPKIYDSSTGVLTVGTKPALNFASSNMFNLTSSINITNENFFYVTGNIVDVTVYGTGSASYVRNQAFRYLLYDGTSFYAANISPSSGYSLQTVINNDGVYQNSSKLANFANTLNIAGNSILKANAAGSYQELIIYDADQSSNRTGIETNINDFYSIYP